MAQPRAPHTRCILKRRCRGPRRPGRCARERIWMQHAHTEVAPNEQLARNFQRHIASRIHHARKLKCVYFFFLILFPSAPSLHTEGSTRSGVSVALCINLPLQRSIQPDKMTNDSYVNARGNILLIAFKITIILGAPGVGGGWWVLKVRLGHSRSATSINKFKLLFQIHHSHTNQCSCPA